MTPFDATVDAIVRIIRNPDVKLPLTIVINGEWGSGKSSVMNNVQGELEHGKDKGLYPTTWFNVWHLQNGQNLMDEFMRSLVRAVERNKSISFWNKIQLLFNRLTKLHFLRQVIFWAFWGLAVPFVVIFSFRIISPLYDLYHFVKPHLPGLLTDFIHGYWIAWKIMLFNVIKGASFAKSLVSLTTILLPALLSVLYFRKDLMPEGLGPLLGMLVPMEGLKASEDKKELGYREKFKRQFWEAMEAAPAGMRLVVFIDDMDRINGAQILEMLEALDFIRDTASTPPDQKETVEVKLAFVIGMATSEVALNLGNLLNQMSPDGMDIQSKGFRYIEKMMNVVVPVPAITMGELFLNSPKAAEKRV